MKKILLTVFMLFVCSFAQAQCNTKIVAVIQHPTDQGIFIVQTRYTLPGNITADIGGFQYNSVTDKSWDIRDHNFKVFSGSNEWIAFKAKRENKVHCRSLISRIKENREYIKLKFEETVMGLDRDITTVIDFLKTGLIGYQTSQTTFSKKFRGKLINVTDDKIHSISDDTIVTP